MSTTAASNTSVQSLNIGEGCPPSIINDGMRAMISQSIGALRPVTAGGTADALTATLAPAPDALTDGMMARVRATAANATTTPTFAPNGLTAHTITKNGNKALAIGDIVGAGYEMILCYVLANTAWELLNPQSSGYVETSGTIASATTTNIGAASANYLQVTGTTTITAFDTVTAGTKRFLEFAGILTLTHNATTLILPGAASITTAAGDVAIMVSEGSGNWRCANYMRSGGQPSFVGGTVVVQDRKASGSAGSSITANTFTDRDLNTIVLNTIGGVTAVSTPNITLPAGTYDVTAIIVSTPGGVNGNRVRLFNTTDSVVQVDINSNRIVGVNGASASVSAIVVTNVPNGPIRARFTIAAQKNLKFQEWASGTTVGGTALNGSGNTEPEVYLTAEFVKVG
jgi:hypothetical protein